MTPATETNKPGQKRLLSEEMRPRLFPHGTESMRRSDLDDRVPKDIWLLVGLIVLAWVVVGAIERWDDANHQEPVAVSSSSEVGR